jgi:Na+-transporting methylmalonyl-CoA/oxaloacetate decarboxylase gamma subunit
MSLSSKVIKALKLDKEDAPKGAAAPAANAQDNAIVAAIAAAVHDKQ